MNVLVNGIGNIGQTVLAILKDYQSLLGITNVYALKNTSITAWNRTAIDILSEKGIVICTKEKSKYKQLDTIIDSIDYIFDCNANSFGLKNKDWYSSLKNLKGCSTQGSEKGFGIPFMSNVNENKKKNEKFVQIVSCNTHSLSSILTTFSNNNLDEITESDFVIVRRSEDLGNKERLVGANVLSRHLDNSVGTHHAIDVKDLFKTFHQELDIQSSDITTPSQLMHSVRFNLKFKKLPLASELKDQISKNNYISTTNTFDSNIIFELGRRHSKYGRLFSHCIINENNLLWDENHNRLKGWVFIPQEGNTILSTIHAFLIQTKSDNHLHIIEKLKSELIREEW